MCGGPSWGIRGLAWRFQCVGAGFLPGLWGNDSLVVSAYRQADRHDSAGRPCSCTATVRTSFVFSFKSAIFPVVVVLWFTPNLRGRWRDPASPYLLPIAWFESYFLMLNICVYVKKTLILGYVLKHLSVCWGSFIYAVCFICRSSFPTFLIL